MPHLKTRIKLLAPAILIAALLFAAGCSNETEMREDYEKCASVCASVVGDDFTTLKLCNDECAEKFLSGESPSNAEEK